MDKPKKSLGQHWLKDKTTLEYIAGLADLTKNDTVLEVGPGQGDLTKILAAKAGKVVAVELDEELAAKLSPADNLEVVTKDILEFDLAKLPAGYKVAANIPYYLTGKLLRMLTDTNNLPSLIVLLVQKEVAQRVCAKPGQMSVLAANAQLFYQAELGNIVPAKLFIPPPKVDSQAVVLSRRQQPLFKDLDRKKFFQIVRAGFSNRRKKLRSSLSAGLQISKDDADKLLERAGVDGNLRAQNLSLEQWYSMHKAWTPPVV